MAPRIIPFFPEHETYVEPFGGGAAVLLAKPRSKLEVYNDLSGDMVTLFRVIRNDAEALAAAIEATPFAREEHELSYAEAVTDIERARRVLVRSHFGFGSNGIDKPTGFRAAGLRAGTLPVHTWNKLPEAVRMAGERMKGVVIERRPAVQVMQDHDGPGTLHYVDPPYLLSTRGRASGRYSHEMTDAEHEVLLTAVRDLRGVVVVSGYAHPLYDESLADWRRVEIAARADKALARTEVLWINRRKNLDPILLWFLAA